MHFEILVEDASGKVLLDKIVPRIINPGDTFKVKSYRGIGRIPKNLMGKSDPSKRILLDRLPQLLRGYANSFHDYPATVVVVVDLDKRNCIEFKKELVDLWKQHSPRLHVLFRIAIEEMEAWLLGDRKALESAYPNVKEKILNNYRQDTICGTWEILADALYKGGTAALRKLKSYPEIGAKKIEWAGAIGEKMNIEKNLSPSFCVFRDGLRRYAGK